MLFTPQRLAKVDGVSSRKVYLAVLGTMFDVTKGWGHYGARLYPHRVRVRVQSVSEHRSRIVAGWCYGGANVISGLS